MLFKKILLLSALGLSTTFASAQALLLNDSNLRSDLNWLNQQGVIQLSTSTWPISADAVTSALTQATVKNNAQQKVLDAVAQKLKPASLATAQIKVASDQNRLPSAFADTANTQAQYEAGLTLQHSTADWDIHLQTNIEDKQRIKTNSKLNLNGSYAAAKLWNQWLSFGDVPVWWGPGQDGSLIRGDATRPVVGFSAQRAEQQAFETKWLSWLGPWQYQLFAGQLQHYTAVPQAKLLGMRLTIQPFSFLELGASRTIQIGGKGQPSDSSAYWNAIIGNDNDCNSAGCVNNENASNQLAGFDARLNLQPLLNMPLAVYGQMIGEDESGKLPSRNLYLAGIDFSSSYNGLPYQLYAEWADTRTSGKVEGYTYSHHQYTDGYYQYGYPIGHAMGGDGQMYSMGGNIQLDPMNRLKARVLYAKVNQSDLAINYAFNQKDTLKALELGWTNTFKPGYEIQLNGWAGRSEYRSFDNGVSLGVKFPLVF
ncbi:capsule assembly Wzi family protein [Acinetobacter sp. B10A]|uniref:capsule assembly Wzi family protein n=1 Tax=Acinetobacter baretiae TaxID=2605383 RepID=UPI001B3C88AB|nr:capsule assembly Wzi family protein [Acinetobacter baretiae]MBF7685634.1 capsule assembly Wzi family protein [Acinetobacter baretiae]